MVLLLEGTAAAVHAPELQLLLQRRDSAPGPLATTPRAPAAALMTLRRQTPEPRPESTLRELLPRGYVLYAWQKEGLTAPFVFVFEKKKKSERDTERKLFSESFGKSSEDLVLLSPTLY